MGATRGAPYGRDLAKRERDGFGGPTGRELEDHGDRTSRLGHRIGHGPALSRQAGLVQADAPVAGKHLQRPPVGKDDRLSGKSLILLAGGLVRASMGPGGAGALVPQDDRRVADELDAVEEEPGSSGADRPGEDDGSSSHVVSGPRDGER